MNFEDKYRDEKKPVIMQDDYTQELKLKLHKRIRKSALIRVFSVSGFSAAAAVLIAFWVWNKQTTNTEMRAIASDNTVLQSQNDTQIPENIISMTDQEAEWILDYTMDTSLAEVQYSNVEMEKNYSDISSDAILEYLLEEDFFEL